MGRVLAEQLPGGLFQDGDDLPVAPDVAPAERWRRRRLGLLRLAEARAGGPGTLVLTYPLLPLEVAAVRRRLRRAGLRCLVVTLTTSLRRNLDPPGPRRLDAAERLRIRQMRSEGHARGTGWTGLSLPNLAARPAWTAARCRKLAGSQLPRPW
ncbi:hypothetical protein [Roseomonas elaeocarpi]|uniref:Uncharacterized protein n=1 Tax=Roseomonas elaeocarpi TaxID=907779 RepID=A0ABV6JUF6_9PROT